MLVGRILILIIIVTTMIIIMTIHNITNMNKRCRTTRRKRSGMPDLGRRLTQRRNAFLHVAQAAGGRHPATPNVFLRNYTYWSSFVLPVSLVCGAGVGSPCHFRCSMNGSGVAVAAARYFVSAALIVEALRGVDQTDSEGWLQERWLAQ